MGELIFKNMAIAALYIMELEGQISDGKYENSRPRGHWTWLNRDIKYSIDSNNPGYRSLPIRIHYNLNEWPRYMHSNKDSWAIRAYWYAKFGSILPNSELDTMIKESYNLREEIELLGNFWQSNPALTSEEVCQKFAEHVANCRFKGSFSKITLMTDENIKKFIESEYSEKDYREDIKGLAEMFRQF